MEFSSPWFILFMLGTGCYVMTFITRRVVETAFPKLKPIKVPAEAAVAGTTVEDVTVKGQAYVYQTGMGRWWNDVILVALGPAWGLLIAVVLHSDPRYPEDFKPWLITVMAGVVMGFMCGLCYSFVKKIFMEKAGISTEADMPSMKPPPIPGGDK